MQSRAVVSEQFGKVKAAFWAVGLLSCVVNILMLTGPIFMLQVYDRVLASQSVPTLVALFALAVGLYSLLGVFDFFRNRILSRVSMRLDQDLSPQTYRSWLVRSLSGYMPGYRPLQDLGAVRGFLSCPTILALFDLPWFPFYLAIVYLLHVQLGLLATAGAVLVGILALLNEALSSRASGDASQYDQLEARFSDMAQRNADSVLSMGMLGNTIKAWGNLRNTAIAKHQKGSELAQYFSALSKASRLLLQSAILGLGAYLAIGQEITAGAIVAASIIAGRALAPIDQTIGGWKMIKRSREAHRRLSDYLQRDAKAQPVGVQLPPPTGQLTFQNVVKLPPDRPGQDKGKPILSGIHFNLKPGDGLGVIGPSASGKSSLARLLVGLWMPDSGSVRMDGATFEQWDADDLGQYIGYLPQQVELLSGTIAQNIARFAPDPDEQMIIEAAKIAGVHEMILRFPEGYKTSVDTAITPLTGGQRQRIALARAVYGKPVLIVLDEPNSNLDSDGDAALANAIQTMRERGCVVIVMAHRPSAIAAVDQILMLKDGAMLEFGPKAEILRKITKVA